ncbi:N-acetyltransferase [Jannaschia sp. Os4]|uniref:GNAT family N-acetyltransferase n=1 Tax=Jannaschia sp. Os4 TaxID=2807617 RepID=UPI00193A035E|nr:N-acetyltransferase [Jannaschia sp. Os4]MBM2574875.1 N-acetyltransferase [Jannaschia sp. Os4]
MEIAPETSEDWWEVEALLDLCFGPGRTALSSYRLRDGVDPVPALCLVARDGGAIAGAIRTWPCAVGTRPALLLGPVAVHPTRQGEGLGAQLIGAVLSIAPTRVILVGDEPYYRRFGFRRLHGVEMPPPTNPGRVLGVGDWTGVTGPVTRATTD